MLTRLQTEIEYGQGILSNRWDQIDYDLLLVLMRFFERSPLVSKFDIGMTEENEPFCAARDRHDEDDLFLIGKQDDEYHLITYPWDEPTAVADTLEDVLCTVFSGFSHYLKCECDPDVTNICEASNVQCIQTFK